MPADRVQDVSVSVIEITPQTRWIFIEIVTQSGMRGVGEATLSGQEAEVATAAANLAPLAMSLPGIDPTLLPPHTPSTLPAAAAFSALDQALWDAWAQQQAISVAEALGGVRRSRVPVYANINRRTVDRSPDGFAESALKAVRAGHRAIKLAPFDEVLTGMDVDGDPAPLVPGLARIAAVRQAVDAGIALMVDCHWRFTPSGAQRVIAATAEIGVSWLECPIHEAPDRIDDIVGLRRAANRYGIALAGLETKTGIAGFSPFVRAGAYDVMMPDVKYVGGLAEVIRLADLLAAAGIGFAPHNPSGPVCHAASLHVAAAVGELHSVETQFGETPLFSALAGANLTSVDQGTMAVPTGPGLGVRFQNAAAEDRHVTRWSAAQAMQHQ